MLLPYLHVLEMIETFKLANKLECYITLDWKGITGSNTLAYWAHL